MDVLERNGNVTDIATRDLAKGDGPEPVAPSLATVPPGGAPGKRGRIFAADLPRGADALGRDKALRPLAELAAHRDTEAPLTIALLGPSGSGKSFALAKLLAEIEALSAAGADGSPFLTRIAAVRINAASLEGEPSVALAGALYEKLETDFPEFVREVAHAVRDPQSVAHEMAERLDAGRRRLDAERQKLEEIETRRARLAETLLFESAGSQVDAYARANRTKIESRLERFGIAGEPIANYKSIVRDIAESGGPSARVGAALRAFWAFKGQTRLLLIAAILVLAGIGLDAAVADQAEWLAWLRRASPALSALPNWIEAHIDWLTLAAKAAYVAAAIALLANLWRGVRFLRPLFRGVGLLQSDVLSRRRGLDTLYAHQMQRVDGAEADVELAARRVAEAARRAGNPTRSEAQAEPSPFEDSSRKAQADRFFAALGAFKDGIPRNLGGPGAPGGLAPQRVVVALDDIDALPQERTHALLGAAHRAFANAGIVTLLAVDPARIGANAATLEKWIQVPFRVGAADAADHAAYVAHVIGRAGAEDVTTRAEIEGPPIDWSISAAESGLLAALAPLAGGSPRAIKRFVNLYRIARAQAAEHKGVLALMLALEQGGAASEIAALADALAEGAPDADLDLQHATPRLFAALQTVEALEGRVSIESGRRAAAVAKMFSLRT